ncbi:hypothetical protein FCIRC_5511 [Fusarium circinatum]|uniref:Uncharacterized protein n=1 Tax=Fusarium circinatum TaxID=48490 RepID=A0A8H5X350_FUSCI|nr:hypothetical protein FCIRC_5511 [Fusarium circinatum]
MDPFVPIAVASSILTILDRILPLLKAASLARSYVKEREGLLDRKKWKDSVRLGPHGAQFHGGWYIALEGESCRQYFWGGGSPQENAGEKMQNNPPQGDNIRLELVEEGSHGSENPFPLATGFEQVSMQWEQANSDAWHHVTIYETALPIEVRRYIEVLEEGQEKRAYITVRSKDNWKKLFLLQFHHAYLRLFFDFLTALEAYEKEQADEANAGTVSAELWQWNLRNITQRSYEYRDLGEMGPRDINQTRGVQQLTLLATIFLSLSLAAGVLSMQTRFQDLGTLLYDFFGVVVLLAAIVLIIMILMSLVAVVNEVDSKFSIRIPGYGEDFRGKILFTINTGFFVFGCLAFSSFLVGMFKDVSLGAKILGPQRPLNPEDRPHIPIPAANLDGIIDILRTRGDFTHEAWGKCLATLEAVEDDGDAEPGVFPVLDAMEEAFQEVVTDLREISSLSDEARKDITILLRPESDARG